MSEYNNAWMRANRPSYSELSPDDQRKSRTRAYTNVLIGRGRIVKQPCSICAAPKAQAHHPDYGNPRLVEWYCVNHHKVVHAIINEGGTIKPSHDTIEATKRGA